MGPPELLRETEKAAGEKDLIVWHQKLTDLGSSLRLQMTKLESEINEMNNLEERNHALERDVRRYEERQRIERKVSGLTSFDKVEKKGRVQKRENRIMND